MLMQILGMSKCSLETLLNNQVNGLLNRSLSACRSIAAICKSISFKETLTFALIKTDLFSRLANSFSGSMFTFLNFKVLKLEKAFSKKNLLKVVQKVGEECLNRIPRSNTWIECLDHLV